MLEDHELLQLFQRCGFSDEAQTVVTNIRVSGPYRRASSKKSNSGLLYTSSKLEETVQATHSSELAPLYEMEYDDNILEFYDQPPPIKIEYYTKSGRKVAFLHTPDFFTLRKYRAGWDEWKKEETLNLLAEERPNCYVKGEDGCWHCPPGENYAAQLGFFYRLRSTAEINWVFQCNTRFLEDYLQEKKPVVSPEASKEILFLVEHEFGITLDKLLKSLKFASNSDIYILIATGDIYVDVCTDLLVQPERTRIFRDRSTAQAYIKLNTEQR